MELKKVTAIVRTHVLEEVENKLKEICACGVTISNVEGYGEYANLFKRDWMVPQVKIEIFTKKEDAETIAFAIMEASHAAGSDDGIVAVLPVEKLFRVRSKAEVDCDDI